MCSEVASVGGQTGLICLRDTPCVPAEPDRAWVDDWLHRTHLRFWASQQ